MPKNLSHAFVSAIADGTDATLVRPSNWNADHVFWLGYRTVTATPDTIAHADHFTLITYNSVSAIAVTLPAPAGGNMPLGWKTTLRNISSGAVTITGGGGATINIAGVANASYVLNQGDTLDIYSIGTASYYGVVVKSPTTGVPPVTISATAPASPAVGNLWWDSNGGQLYVWYDDGTSQQWVVVVNAAMLGAITMINVQTFTASGTYTPSANMKYCSIECIGAGGGGGGCSAATTTYEYWGSGGGSGSYSKKTVNAATIGASQTVTVGVHGNGGNTSATNGTNGGDTSVGTLCIGKGGGGGSGYAGSGIPPASTGGVAGTGDVTAVGTPGGAGGFCNVSANSVQSPGFGGSSVFGGGGRPVPVLSGSSTAASLAGQNYGAGGAGGISNSATGAAGGNGSDGFVIITEYL